MVLLFGLFFVYVGSTQTSATSSSWSGANSTNKFNVSYLIGENGAYAGKATGVNVIPVVYTVTQP